MITIETIERVKQIYDITITSLNQVLFGQNNVKKVLATSILCDSNARILLTGNTGMGKTSLAKFFSNNFLSKRISVTSDMLPSDLQNQLKKYTNLRFLHIDEFNRANGKVQSAFVELLEENQMTIDEEQYQFNDFYLIATQNSSDISGIFNIPQNVYDRIDVNIYFDALTEEEKRQILFQKSKQIMIKSIQEEDLQITRNAVNHFEISKKEEDVMLKIFNLIDQMTINEKRIFGGSNIRAHKFALKIAKLTALVNQRDYILPADIADFIKYIYMHRIDQNIARIGDELVEKKFNEAKKKILSMKNVGSILNGFSFK